MGNVTPEAIGLGFSLVIAAGLCTALGAALAFCTNINNTKVLAGALGLSAGVMLYVSFVEILSVKSVEGFLSAGYDTPVARRYAMLTFFGGMVLLWLLDKMCHLIIHLSSSCGKRDLQQVDSDASGVKAAAAAAAAGVSETAVVDATSSTDGSDSTPAPEASVSVCLHCAPDTEGSSSLDASSQSCAPAPACKAQEGADMIQRVLEVEGDDSLANPLAQAHTGKLVRTGLLSALAIGIHNFPEGLATFVGTLAQPSAGVAIAVATALHNIPEGIVVAMPIYYATGSKLRGFLWAVLSGMSEPIGALLGYLILRGNDMHPLVYGLLFAGVAGMMVYISVHELLPTALKYDAEDRWTTRCALLGMAIMAASLLLFEL